MFELAELGLLGRRVRGDCKVSSPVSYRSSLLIANGPRSSSAPHQQRQAGVLDRLGRRSFNFRQLSHLGAPLPQLSSVSFTRLHLFTPAHNLHLDLLPRLGLQPLHIHIKMKPFSAPYGESLTGIPLIAVSTMVSRLVASHPRQTSLTPTSTCRAAPLVSCSSGEPHDDDSAVADEGRHSSSFGQRARTSLADAAPHRSSCLRSATTRVSLMVSRSASSSARRIDADRRLPHQP